MRSELLLLRRQPRTSSLGQNSTGIRKKSDFEVFSNFRPVSNLVFTSKLTEKAAAHQLTSYTLNNDLGNFFSLHTRNCIVLKQLCLEFKMRSCELLIVAALFSLFC